MKNINSAKATPEDQMRSHKTETKPVNFQHRLENYRLSNEKYLDRNYGPGTWTHDPFTNDYYVFDDTYTGPGRGYLVLDQNLRSAPITVVVN